MAGISTHVLDTGLGRPASGIAVRLDVRYEGSWDEVGSGTTDDDGRIADLLEDEPLLEAVYRISFATGEYLGEDAFYPEASITFRVLDPAQHHHIPLLLNRFGYTTYRGS